jgi:hypothetical protein
MGFPEVAWVSPVRMCSPAATMARPPVKKGWPAAMTVSPEATTDSQAVAEWPEARTDPPAVTKAWRAAKTVTPGPDREAAPDSGASHFQAPGASPESLVNSLEPAGAARSAEHWASRSAR